MEKRIWTLAIAVAVAAMVVMGILWQSSSQPPAAPVPEEVNGY